MDRDLRRAVDLPALHERKTYQTVTQDSGIKHDDPCLTMIASLEGILSAERSLDAPFPGIAHKVI